MRSSEYLRQISVRSERWPQRRVFLIIPYSTHGSADGVAVIRCHQKRYELTSSLPLSCGGQYCKNERNAGAVLFSRYQNRTPSSPNQKDNPGFKRGRTGNSFFRRRKSRGLLPLDLQPSLTAALVSACASTMSHLAAAQRACPGYPQDQKTNNWPILPASHRLEAGSPNRKQKLLSFVLPHSVTFLALHHRAGTQ